MSNIVDLIDIHSASRRHILGDDTNPTLKLSNSNSSLAGRGLETDGVDITQAAAKIPAANATVVKFHVAGASRASGAVLALTGDAFVSATSIDMDTTAAVAGHGAIRIVLTDGTFGWIPVFPDGRVDAAAI